MTPGTKKKYEEMKAERAIAKRYMHECKTKYYTAKAKWENWNTQIRTFIKPGPEEEG